MPSLRTDDAVRRLRAVWLGPKGKTLAFEWTYVQWALCLGLVALGGGLGLGVLWPVDHGFATVAGPLWGGVAGVFATQVLIAHTSYDQPLRWWRTTLRDEWAHSSRLPRSRREAVQTPPTVQLPARIAASLWLNRRESGPAALGIEGRRGHADSDSV